MSDNEKNNEIREIKPVNQHGITLKGPDAAWMEATQGLQSNLLGSLREYRASILDRRTVGKQRRVMLEQVTKHYISYLEEEARLSTDAALKARSSILQKELNQLRANLFADLADLTGATVRQLEQILKHHESKIETPEIKQAYSQFVMSRIFELMEMNQSDDS